MHGQPGQPTMVGSANAAVGCSVYDSDLVAVRCLLTGVVSRAGQGTRLHVLESHRHPNLAPPIELFRPDVAFDRQSSGMRLQVLANRHDVARGVAQVVHELDDFIELLAQSDHDSALCQHSTSLAIASFGGTP